MDPLTAVVICAIAGAGAVVALLQMDDLAIESVDVPAHDLRDGALPAVCCKTGEPATEWAPLLERRRWRAEIRGTVPVTRSQLGRVIGWRRLGRQASIGFVVVASFGIVLDDVADTPVVGWATGLSALTVVGVAVYAHAAAGRALVSVGEDRNGVVTLRRVHPAFAEAVRAARPSR